MSLVDAPVVGCDDDDGIVPHAGFTDGVQYHTHLTVHIAELVIVFGCVVSDSVPHMVGLVKDDGTQVRLLLPDIVCCAQCRCLGVGFILGHMAVVRQRQRVHHILDAFPFIDTSNLGFRRSPV